jgi:hypothetical protein
MSKNKQTNASSATTSKDTVIWEASPSKWLLLSKITISVILFCISVISVYSYLGEKIPFANSTLLQFQVFLSQNTLINYTIWAMTFFTLMSTLFMYVRLACEKYIITKEKLSYITGVFNRDIDETKLFRVIDISVEIPFLLRLVGRGHVILFSNDPSLESSGIKQSLQTPDGRKGVYLSAIKNPIKVKDIIAEQVELQRTKYTTRSTELL